MALSALGLSTDELETCGGARACPQIHVTPLQMALYTGIELDGVPVATWLTTDPKETRFHACSGRRTATGPERESVHYARP